MGFRPARVLITGGPTRAYLDDLRFLTNRATGRLGALMAEAAAARGWEVLYLAGRGSALPRTPPGGGSAPVAVVEIETVDELAAAVREAVGSGRCDAVIHSMAVLDFTPAEVRPGKVSSRDEWTVRLVPAPKVIRLIRELDPRTYLVAFKLEPAGDEAALVAAARAALAANRADLCVANGLASVRGGEHRACIVAAGEDAVEVVAGKEAIARRVVDRVAGAVARRRGGEGEAGRPS